MEIVDFNIKQIQILHLFKFVWAYIKICPCKYEDKQILSNLR